MIRPPAVAGAFYEASAERLGEQISACYAVNPTVEARVPFIAGVVPHAGLMYSGHVAAALYARVELSKRMIILCPNHTGLGRPAAIYRDGAWLTPLGEAKVDSALADELMSESRSLEEDTLAHAREHSLEVQLPFLQLLDSSLSFVPICLAYPDYGRCAELGAAIARVVRRHRDAGEDIRILASSDLNHYEPQKTTLEKDQLAIDRIVALDPEGLWQTVHDEDISMCGIIPTTTMLVAANELGATSAELIKHATSGDINHDFSAVVGYASIVVH